MESERDREGESEEEEKENRNVFSLTSSKPKKKKKTPQQRRLPPLRPQARPRHWRPHPPQQAHLRVQKRSAGGELPDQLAEPLCSVNLSLFELLFFELFCFLCRRRNRQRGLAIHHHRGAVSAPRRRVRHRRPVRRREEARRRRRRRRRGGRGRGRNRRRLSAAALVSGLRSPARGRSRRE